MYNKCKHFFLGLLIIFPSITVVSQTRTFSPFTRYGIGEINQKGFGRNAAMGNTGIGLRSPYNLNPLNPASYTAIDTLSFYFESGISGFSQNINHMGATNSFSEIDFDYFAFGFPITRKIFTSIGIKPASNAGYSYGTISGEGTSTSLQKAMGLGNITNLYGGIGFKINSSWSAGLNVSYWFGNINHTSFSEYINDPDAYKYGIKHEIHLNDAFIGFGLQYSNIAGKNNKYTIGVTFSPKTAIRGESSMLIARGTMYDVDGNLFITNDTLHSEKNKWSKNTFELPLGLGLGASYTFNDKLTFAADFSTRSWADANFPDDKTETTNANYFNFGAEWIPKERTATNYLHRIRYRAGLHYTQDYIKLNGYQVKDFGMSFGIGLPLKRTNTSVNLVYEFGSRGTSETNQVKETYNRFIVNFTLHEYWFVKRKFE